MPKKKENPTIESRRSFFAKLLAIPAAIATVTKILPEETPELEPRNETKYTNASGFYYNCSAFGLFYDFNPEDHA